MARGASLGFLRRATKRPGWTTHKAFPSSPHLDHRMNLVMRSPETAFRVAAGFKRKNPHFQTRVKRVGGKRRRGYVLQYR